MLRFAASCPTRASWPIVLEGPTGGLRNIDEVIGYWASSHGLPVHYHNPSLAQHIGDYSTIWERASNNGLRKSASFMGADFDARNLLTSAIQESK